MKLSILLCAILLIMIGHSWSQINHQPELIPGTNENNTYYAINNNVLSGLEIENVDQYLLGDYAIFSIKHDNYTIRIWLYPKYRPEIDGPGFTQKFGSQLENEYRLNKKISSYMFNDGITKKKFSGINYIDSIVLSAFSSDDIQFTRRSITSFENYFLIVDIMLAENKVKEIFEKTPEYFFIQDGAKTWNYKTNQEKKAVDDIYSRKIRCIDALQWYDLTTEILKGIKYTFQNK
jgi:hypothetical protein